MQPKLPTSITKSRGHKITFNNVNPKLPYRLSWKVARQGGSPGFDVEMHRDSNREGAQEFAERWRVKMPPGQPRG
jgi:hypothetical protein